MKDEKCSYKYSYKIILRSFLKLDMFNFETETELILSDICKIFELRTRMRNLNENKCVSNILEYDIRDELLDKDNDLSNEKINCASEAECKLNNYTIDMLIVMESELTVTEEGLL